MSLWALQWRPISSTDVKLRSLRAGTTGVILDGSFAASVLDWKRLLPLLEQDQYCLLRGIAACVEDNGLSVPADSAEDRVGVVYSSCQGWDWRLLPYDLYY